MSLRCAPPQESDLVVKVSGLHRMAKGQWSTTSEPVVMLDRTSTGEAARRSEYLEVWARIFVQLLQGVPA